MSLGDGRDGEGGPKGISWQLASRDPAKKLGEGTGGKVDHSHFVAEQNFITRRQLGQVFRLELPGADEGSVRRLHIDQETFLPSR